MDEAGDELPRAKFLCSFGGSIIPRPLDARLRYVGGETRIVSLPRDVTYDDLLSRMRDLFDGVSIIKYQQPDEDLDALVSVVNDDDVVNMMEEYDKLLLTSANGDGGGCSRIRIFLFSHHNTDPDAAAAAQFDVDERENERRYVDALNNLEISTNLENSDQFLGLHQLNIPHPHARLGEESPWSPAYFSPQFPNSPSAGPPLFDQQSPTLVENLMWGPPGVGIVQEKGGFPGNIGHAHNVFEGSNVVCEHCRMGFQRDPRYVDPRWNQPGCGNEYMGHFAGSCSDCYRAREMPRFYNEAHGHDRGWIPHMHQGGHDPRMHRIGDHYVVDGNVMNAPFGQVNYYDGHDDDRYPRQTGNEFGNEVFHGQQAGGQGNHPAQYGLENPYQVPPNLPPIQNLRGRAQVPARSGMAYDSSRLMAPNGFVRSTQDLSLPVPHVVLDDQFQSPWSGQNGGLSQKNYLIDDHGSRLNPNFVNQDERILVAPVIDLGVKVEVAIEANVGIGDSNANVGHEGHRMTYLPELTASVQKVALESPQEVKAVAEENPENKKEPCSHELEAENGQHDLEPEADAASDQMENSRIEPTTAEAEALAQGLQTIKYDDLEEVRELGSGTYGSVYHGKWKGSDVAIKKIKASCFNGKPSERERLIADFWREALMLSSLHHPNVVSFYGVARDGPDGSLATVTEFMVNGSLKQFLKKKDRTIDRRKRLIIAMDAAFGMEYVHGKNIVHFDLKCENLLVNMRDPQRPICKIGDLGLSKVKQRTLVSGGVRGTLPWMAPELLSGKNNMVTEKVDVYSFGIVMWELLTGEDPYGDMHCGSILGTYMSSTASKLHGENLFGAYCLLLENHGRNIEECSELLVPIKTVKVFKVLDLNALSKGHQLNLKGGIMENSLRPQIPTWCDPEWKSLMESCWSSVPAERPSFTEISQRLRKMAAAINVK